MLLSSPSHVLLLIRAAGHGAVGWNPSGVLDVQPVTHFFYPAQSYLCSALASS